MLKFELLPRPFSCHAPRVPGYSPTIRCEIWRATRSSRNGWRGAVIVNGRAMYVSYHNTRSATEAHLAHMMAAYTDTHYVSK